MVAQPRLPQVVQPQVVMGKGPLGTSRSVHVRSGWRSVPLALCLAPGNVPLSPFETGSPPLSPFLMPIVGHYTAVAGFCGAAVHLHWHIRFPEHVTMKTQNTRNYVVGATSTSAGAPGASWKSTTASGASTSARDA